MSFDDPKDKKPDQDIFDVEEYLEERLAELESYEDYHYEEEGDIERRYNNNPIDSYFFDDSGPKSIEPPALKRNKSFVRYNELMKRYVNDLSRLTHNLKPSTYQIISGSGPAWFYEPITKRYIKTERGSEVVVVPGLPDETGRLLVRTMGTFLLIPYEEVLDLGYN
jgi:hypothetical protein